MFIVLKEIYTAEVNYNVDQILGTHITDLVDDEYVLVENNDVLRVVDLEADTCIIALNGKVKHKITKEIKQTVSVYIVESTNDEELISDLMYKCKEDTLLCIGFKNEC